MNPVTTISRWAAFQYGSAVAADSRCPRVYVCGRGSLRCSARVFFAQSGMQSNVSYVGQWWTKLIASSRRTQSSSMYASRSACGALASLIDSAISSGEIWPKWR